MGEEMIRFIKDAWSSITGGQFEKDGGLVPELEPVPSLVPDAKPFHNLCNCFEKEDMQIEMAAELNILHEFFTYIDDMGLDVVDTHTYNTRYWQGRGYMSRSSRQMINFCFGADFDRGEPGTFSISFRVDGLFIKEACLACSSCLGWKAYSYGVVDERISSPYEYFDTLMNEAMEKQQKHMDTDREIKERSELAKRICEVE